MGNPRLERLVGEPKDHRNAFERDRDRVLYSSAFRRLEGVTQVVGAGQGTIFHNRLIHSIKVAQIGRSLAQRLIGRCPQLKPRVNPAVVECACLAHDLGHPPFGHIGEKELNRLLEGAGDDDGFEGNAQSFRIVTKLAVRTHTEDGLNLTRATLAAILKYPWLRDRKNEDRSKKWGAYRIDAKAFRFATDNLNGRSIEAAIMDMADDLTYSVHDLEDFYRAGLIPLGILYLSAGIGDEQDKPVQGEALELVKSVVQSWWKSPHPEEAHRRAESALKRVLGMLDENLRVHYQGEKRQRASLRRWSSTLLSRYVTSVTLNDGPEGGIALLGETKGEEYNRQDEVLVLKGITRLYAHRNPALAAQQFGQARILRELFRDLSTVLKRDKGPHDMIPVKFRHLTSNRESGVARAVADCLASMTEEEVVLLHQRLRGISVGSVLNPIVR